MIPRLRPTRPARDNPRVEPLDLERIPRIVRAPRTDAIYNCHAYLTKIPRKAIEPFIETFTRPGESVADMFAGSGMTALVAASLGRTSRASDISILGQHISRGYLTHASSTAIAEAARTAIDRARRAIGAIYQTTRAGDRAEAEMIRTVWSFVYVCPRCSEKMIYFEHLDRHGKAPSGCPSCGERFVRRSWARAADVPVRVVLEGSEGRQIEQAVQAIDLEHIAAAERDPRQSEVPSLEITRDREMYGRSGLGRAGIHHTRQFFSPRNALALLELWRAIASIADDDVRCKLRFAFTASLARASRRYQWGPKRPLNAQNQTYYLAPVHYEWNVFELFARKVEAVLRSDALLHQETPELAPSFTARASYTIASADALHHLEDASIDYVFTDPPFGSNIFYSDMNLFHEAWLGTATHETCEAVMHTSGPKAKDSAARYERLLRGAFAEASRVLKPGRFMSVVFGNSSGAIWALVLRALRDAGFLEPVHVAILDKGQRSVKGLSSGSEGVVTVDLVLTVQKPATERSSERGDSAAADLRALLASAAAELAGEHAKNPSYIYAALVRESIRRGAPLDRLHYSEVLGALRELGFQLDPKQGLLDRPITAGAF